MREVLENQMVLNSRLRCHLATAVSVSISTADPLLHEPVPHHIQHTNVNVIFYRQIIQSTRVGVCLWAC